MACLMAPARGNCGSFPEPVILSFMRRILLVGLLLMTAVSSAQETATASIPGLNELKQMAARFAPTPLEVDTSELSSGDQQALVKLIQAAQTVNHLFMGQLWSGNLPLY